MEPAKRIIVNTLAQYVRSVFNIILSLYSTRLVLSALGNSDFGVYSLISGVVVMLGFITNALVATTQRNLSFYHGKGDMAFLHKVFSTSLFLHLGIGTVVSLVLIALTPLLFNGFLHIDSGRIDVAKMVYFTTIANLFVSFVTAPYRALFFARENIVYISVVDVLDGIFKLLLAVWLIHVDADKLFVYSIMMAGITCFNLLAFALYATRYFPEARLRFSRADFEKQLLRDMLDFTAWTIYSTGCILGRVQGVAIVLNRFFSTLVNSAYGIALQASGAIQFVAVAVLNAMSPQVVKAEGAGNREKMLRLAETSSKYSYLMMSMVVFPVVFEMDSLLSLWLKDVPEHSAMFCRFILLATVCDQLTIGLGTANQAIGKIRLYSIVVNTTKLLTLPVAYILLLWGYNVSSVMWTYLLIEILCMLIRMPFMNMTAGLSVGHFVAHVFGRCVLPTLALVFMGVLFTRLSGYTLRFLLSIPTTILVDAVVVWYAALEPDERTMALSFLKRKKS